MQVNANSMMAHSNWMASNSNNVANVNSKNFKATDTTLQSQAEGDVQATFSKSEASTDLTKEITEQIPIEEGFEAQVAAIKTQDEMLGSLLDLQA